MFSWKEQERIGVDAKLLELEQPEIFKKYKTVTKSRVFRIS
jgi:predicted phage-related endonuclease